MTRPEEPLFFDPLIDWERWEATNKRLDEDRKRVEDTQVKTGIAIFYRDFDKIESLGETVDLPKEPEDIDQEIFGDFGPHLNFESLIIQRTANQARILVGAVGRYYRSDFLVRFKFTVQRSEDGGIVRFKANEPVGPLSSRNLRPEYSQIQLIRMVNWLLQYYRKYAGQSRKTTSDLPLDASEDSS